jgi:hypothetical protein
MDEILTPGYEKVSEIVQGQYERGVEQGISQSCARQTMANSDSTISQTTLCNVKDNDTSGIKDSERLTRS